MKKSVVSWATVAAMFLASPAWGDWIVADGHKMHFPQLPNPQGWDVEISSWDNQHECADDWRCSATGPVRDIHFWYSVRGDGPTVIDHVTATIYTDDRTGAYSKPGDPMWSRTFDKGEFAVVSPAGTGDQGFGDPQQGIWGSDDHKLYHQLNITDIPEPFTQRQGEIYWLGLYVNWDATPQEPVGWKTSLSHFEDFAVYRKHVPGAGYVLWTPLTTQYGAPIDMDFAFVITPEPSAWMMLASGGLAMLWFLARMLRYRSMT